MKTSNHKEFLSSNNPAQQAIMVEVFDLYGPRGGTMVSFFECPDPKAVVYENGIPVNVIEFKASCTPKSVFEFMQKPYLAPLDKVSGVALTASLRRITNVLKNYKIEIQVNENISPEEVYRFIHQDVLPASIGISNLPATELKRLGFKDAYHLFDYDKFHSNLAEKLAAKTERILKDFLLNSMEDFFAIKEDDAEVQESMDFLHERLKAFHGTYEDIEIQNISTEISESDDSLYTVEYTIDFMATERSSKIQKTFKSTGIMRFIIQHIMNLQVLSELSLPFLDDLSLECAPAY